MTEETCALCGHPFDSGELPRPGNELDLDRAHTALGPMHFGCYWKAREIAAKSLLYSVKG